MSQTRSVNAKVCPMKPTSLAADSFTSVTGGICGRTLPDSFLCRIPAAQLPHLNLSNHSVPTLECNTLIYFTYLHAEQVYNK